MAADTNKIRLYIERVNLKTFIIALVVASFGVFLLYLSTKNLLVSREVLQTVVRDIGALLLVTGAITLLWELWAKRAFLDEVLAKVQMADEVKQAGFVRVTDRFHREIDWESLFRSVNKLDIFFAYGHTWRSTHMEELKKLAAKKGARIRVVLPDPEDEQTVSELSRRFDVTAKNLKN